MNPTTIDWLITHFGEFGIGGLVGATIVFLILAGFLPSYLNEKAKNLASREDIANLTTAVESVRLEYSKMLQHDSRIHERQLEILAKIFKNLSDVLEYAKQATKSGVFKGEDPSKYPELLGKSFYLAYDEFLAGQLFLTPSIVTQIQTFFKRTWDSQMYFNLARDPQMPDGTNRAQHWEKAATIAHSELPILLQAIETEAREIIHGRQEA